MSNFQETLQEKLVQVATDTAAYVRTLIDDEDLQSLTPAQLAEVVAKNFKVFAVDVIARDFHSIVPPMFSTGNRIINLESRVEYEVVGNPLDTESISGQPSYLLKRLSDNKMVTITAADLTRARFAVATAVPSE
jgi:hypothetical protein